MSLSVTEILKLINLQLATEALYEFDAKEKGAKLELRIHKQP
jgi:hypothetical protein